MTPEQIEQYVDEFREFLESETEYQEGYELFTRKQDEQGQVFPRQEDWANYQTYAESNGVIHSVSKQFQVSLITETDKDGIWHRREIEHGAGVSGNHWHSALMVKLGDVRIFIKGQHIVVTKQNMKIA